MSLNPCLNLKSIVRFQVFGASKEEALLILIILYSILASSPHLSLHSSFIFSSLFTSLIGDSPRKSIAYENVYFSLSS